MILVKWPIKRKSRFIDSHDRSPYSSYPKPIDYKLSVTLNSVICSEKVSSIFFLPFSKISLLSDRSKVYPSFDISYLVTCNLSLFPTTRGWLLYSRIYRDTPDMPATPYILWYDINKICLWDKVLVNHTRNFWLSIVRR